MGVYDQTIFISRYTTAQTASALMIAGARGDAYRAHFIVAIAAPALYGKGRYRSLPGLIRRLPFSNGRAI